MRRGSRDRGWFLVGIVSVLSLGATLFMVLLGGDLYSPRSAGPDVFSRSFIGQQGFVDLLRDLGRPFHLSRDPRLLDSQSARAAWIMAPTTREQAEETWHWLHLRLERDDQITAIVLPKRKGQVDPMHAGWIATTERIALEDVQAVVDSLVSGLEVVRPTGDVRGWDPSEIEAHPELDEPQLVIGPDLVPVVACDEGVLVGWVHPRDAVSHHWILLVADPDLVANGGLARGGNARLAVRLVDTLLAATGSPLLVDASMQGFARVPSLAAELLRFPLVLVVVHVGLLLVAALMLTLGRFGRAHDPVDHPHPGKLELIENTSRLMLAAGHVGHLGSRYARMLVLEVGRRLHAPRSEDAATVAQWLGSIEIARTRRRSAELLARFDQLRDGGPRAATQVLACTKELDVWREEMMRGTRSHAAAHR